MLEMEVYSDPGFSMKQKRLSDKAYSEAMESMPIVNTDAIIFDPANKTFWLAKRNVLPMNNYWGIGGRRFAGETSEESMVRCFRMETGLQILGHRFRLVRINEYL